MSVVNQMLKDLEDRNNSKLLIDSGETPSDLNRQKKNAFHLKIILVFIVMLISVVSYSSIQLFDSTKDKKLIQQQAKVTSDSSQIARQTDQTIKETTASEANDVKTKQNLENLQLNVIRSEQKETESKSISRTTTAKLKNDEGDSNIQLTKEATLSNSSVLSASVPSQEPVKKMASVEKKQYPLAQTTKKNENSNVVVDRKSIKTVSQRQQLNTTLSNAKQLIEQGLYLRAITILAPVTSGKLPAHQAAELQAYALQRVNKEKELVEFLERRIVRFPAHQNYRLILSRYYASKGLWENVVELTMIEGEKQDTLAIMSALALQKTNRHTRAIDIYSDLLNKDATRGDWWIGLSISLRSIEREKDAIQALRKASSDPRITSAQKRYINSQLNMLAGS